MSQQTTVPKSLVEQIVDEMLASIEDREEFDPETIQRLKELSKCGDLTKPRQIAKAIEAHRVGRYETA